MCDKNGGASFWMNLESYKAILQKMETDSDRSMSGEMGGIEVSSGDFWFAIRDGGPRGGKGFCLMLPKSSPSTIRYASNDETGELSSPGWNFK